MPLKRCPDVGGDVKEASVTSSNISWYHLAYISDLMSNKKDIYPKRHLYCCSAMGPHWHCASWPMCRSWRDDKDTAQMTSSNAQAAWT